MTLHFVNNVFKFFDTDHKSVSVLIDLGGLLDTHLISICKQANQDHFKDCFSAKLLARLDMFKKAKVNGDLNTMWKILEEAIVQTADTAFFRIWYSEYDCLRNKQSSKFFELDLLVAKVVWLAINVVKAFKIDDIVLNGVSSMELIKHLSVVKKGYCKSKYYKSKIAENTTIRKTIDRHMENFCSDKGKMIKSILECPFHKMVLDHLVVDDKLVIELNKVKLKIDEIMEEWTRNVMVEIGMEELFLVVDDLPNNKAARLSEIPNKLWKHCGEEVLACLLKLLNLCLNMGAVPNL
ncbi:hypothetical protein G9A89_022942 [Geosiphon pyriformis]|nr:hypothetical protein G9A89_022942 [Geosiphon pyriformis]